MNCFSQSFFESLVELNALDPNRDIKLDNILDDIVIRFDEFPLEKIHGFFNSTFITASILRLFENTHKLINAIEADQAHKNHILALKAKTKQYLAPILNGLEKDLLLAKAKGDQEEIIKIQTSLIIYQDFLKSKQKVFNLFETAKIFLLNNSKKRAIATRLIPSTKKQKLAKEQIQFFERICIIQKQYRYYDLITEGYQDKLWYSTAIKIYRLCRFINQGAIDDATLKEKIENLFLQVGMKISLNTTRFNDAKCYNVENGIPIWRDGNSQKTISKLLPFYEKYFKEQFKMLKSTPYSKIIENIDNSLFCMV
ncbi:hypothetical protein [Sulfurospirillum cavolei]|uniref:hypothetical protein n=1 Tax=Sulfurospirillum cavolei TaxID=366522 RepID=UPI003FA2C996